MNSTRFAPTTTQAWTLPIEAWRVRRLLVSGSLSVGASVGSGFAKQVTHRS